jgi:hypothetical protein
MTVYRGRTLVIGGPRVKRRGPEKRLGASGRLDPEPREEVGEAGDLEPRAGALG